MFILPFFLKKHKDAQIKTNFEYIKTVRKSEEPQHMTIVSNRIAMNAG